MPLISQALYEQLVEAITFIENTAQNRNLDEIEAEALGLRTLIEALDYVPPTTEISERSAQEYDPQYWKDLK